MRFISKSAVVIKTESLFTLTSRWHHYPLALTCFEDLRLIHPKLKESLSLRPRGFVGSSCRYELPPAPLSEAELHAVESSSLSSDCAQWESWNMCLCFNQTTTRLQSHLTQHNKIIKENIGCVKYWPWPQSTLFFMDNLWRDALWKVSFISVCNWALKEPKQCFC